ncbi:alkaline phosphatase-like protein [Mytilinidion resinicola]|uniref:Alkaline phosphatase-like protein n=1 Tax=Mytilinidion resinicola TaxID=574789 RepID=A0A6A6YBR2_9PEZI|nr:alkaline phosphatase-like protein [Mytilinidion resinicola]KAF2805454.1 alkaline phosphatase-like protein [Mytilinidion resinicola]
MAPKNILVLIADDLGREQMSCYGGPTSLTPNLDGLAASGTRFTNAFASTASCSGSRTTIYTGLHTHQTGSYGLVGEMNGFQTLPQIVTAPKLFNDLGYKTGIINKVHVGPPDVYPWSVRTIEERGGESRDGAMIAARASQFLSDAKAEAKPFFLTIGYTDPHRALGTRGGFGNVEGNHSPLLHDRVFKPDEVQVPPFLSDLPEVRQELAEYYRAIHRLDQSIGLVLSALEKSGLGQDTLVLFLSDNGPPFINSKTTLYDAGIHLPFLLRIPGATPGAVNPNLISYVDVLPTLLAYAGHDDLNTGAAAGPRRGRSILPILSSRAEEEGWTEVYGSHTFHEVTNYWPTRYLRTGRWKYHRNVCWKLDFPFAMDLYASLSFEGIRNSTPPVIGQRSLKSYIQRPAEELYDLEADPLEVNNLAADPAHKEVLVGLRARLENWQEETRDLWLWRDGTAVRRYRNWEGYGREGLTIPDRFDFDVESPGTKGVGIYEL